MPSIRPQSNTSRVYSTDEGRVRDEPRRPSRPQPAAAPSVPNDGVVRVSRSKAGRGGKTVTLVTGVPRGDVDSVAKALKRTCGTGGTVKGDVIEIQGDHRERIAEQLAGSYTTKLAGG